MIIFVVLTSIVVISIVNNYDNSRIKGDVIYILPNRLLVESSEMRIWLNVNEETILESKHGEKIDFNDFSVGSEIMAWDTGTTLLSSPPHLGAEKVVLLK